MGAFRSWQMYDTGSSQLTTHPAFLRIRGIQCVSVCVCVSLEESELLWRSRYTHALHIPQHVGSAPLLVIAHAPNTVEYDGKRLICTQRVKVALEIFLPKVDPLATHTCSSRRPIGQVSWSFVLNRWHVRMCACSSCSKRTACDARLQKSDGLRSHLLNTLQIQFIC
ncbi:hypothetical protein VOLCADRAFT_103863 [Volvox carteri f. nagariensis]|uniref:Uncharacterized protein n=1 Tax=Volvox carteri f. nagariensis TaxID=3068 RepID=D8TPQ6_VOLCA|nr:uncharacterized protein VOLCADRAFT_103863 [Volvox carteri f. nagariensis]EFJ50657.1 hypothetical protein VOLCADRAFT_103863 [Volvox carteri f. nagariensis]|eukprot:XP_002948250.1 hypothetical protein VOLCADRAFT_103863 [Volvox carteri f. nagariensis]